MALSATRAAVEVTHFTGGTALLRAKAAIAKLPSDYTGVKVSSDLEVRTPIEYEESL